MSKQPLGTLERVDLRTYWVNEAADFTPWLAMPENLNLLGDAIGMQLEPSDTEVGVGSFSADLLCHDLADEGSRVVIENQLEKTNHSHLGQILTYAAGLDAKTLVWIARKFTDEHRSAIDWLNRVSSEGLRIFAIEIELWRIGSSPAAPRFQVVAKPNDWTRAVREQAMSAESGATSSLRLDYWTALGAYLAESGSKLQPPAPSNKYWVNLPLGRSGAHLTALVSARDKYVAAKVYFSGRCGPHYYKCLEAQRAEIDKELGSEPTWESKEDRQSCQILFWREANPADRATWPELHRWTREKLEILDRVFRRRIAGLPRPAQEPGGEDE